MASDLSYRPKPGEIPTSPGVYRFLDAESRVLYVGKAKNLRARLSNYFAPLETLHERTRAMVTSASQLVWTVVASDVEALQLEYMWIQEFSPRFNVRYKDDKSYPFLAVTLADEAPRVLITRNRKIPGARYFGPYPKIWAVNEVLDLMIRAFPIRTCNDSDYRKAMTTGKPCLPGQIGRCGGPCSGKVTIAEHREKVAEFVSFLEGGHEKIRRFLDAEMKLAASEFRYEDAAKLRDQIQVVDEVLKRSALVLDSSADADVFTIADDPLSSAMHVFSVRQGRIRAESASILEKELELSPEEALEQGLINHYGAYAQGGLPSEILLPFLPNNQSSLESWLSELGGKTVRLKVPVRGTRKDLLQNSLINAASVLQRYKLNRASDYVARTKALTELQVALDLPEAPLRIECFDISHFGGHDVVGSMVVFEDGLPRKSQYRSFKIAQTRDDTDSIEQVIYRRLCRLSEEESEAGNLRDSDVPDAASPVRFSYRPQLIVVDGGPAQLAAAERALARSGVTGVFICGVAKRLEELWVPNDDFPVILPRNSEAMYLIQRLRDEAHRFAIRHQRKSRSKGISSKVSTIPGVGEVKTKALLRAFGSIKGIKAASDEELLAVSGIGPVLVKQIRDALSER